MFPFLSNAFTPAVSASERGVYSRIGERGKARKPKKDAAARRKAAHKRERKESRLRHNGGRRSKR